jgi:hypothetical protein
VAGAHTSAVRLPCYATLHCSSPPISPHCPVRPSRVPNAVVGPRPLRLGCLKPATCRTPLPLAPCGAPKPDPPLLCSPLRPPLKVAVRHHRCPISLAPPFCSLRVCNTSYPPTPTPFASHPSLVTGVRCLTGIMRKQRRHHPLTVSCPDASFLLE